MNEKRSELPSLPSIKISIFKLIFHDKISDRSRDREGFATVEGGRGRASEREDS